MSSPRPVELMQTSVEDYTSLYQSCAGTAYPVHTHGISSLEVRAPLLQRSTSENTGTPATTEGIAMLSDTQVEGLTADWKVETDEHEEDAFGSKMSATTKESKSVEEHAGDGAPSDGSEVLRSGVAELVALQEMPVQAASSSDTDPTRLGNAYIALLRDSWTSDVLVAGGHTKITESEFNAYLGLEIAMSICPMNEIAEIWSDKSFLGQVAFIETMTRNKFQQIRGALTLHPPEEPSFDKERDPLWRWRAMMEHFQERFAEFAVPVVAAAIIHVDAGERGGWELIAAVGPEPGWQKKTDSTSNYPARIAMAERTTFESFIVQAEKAGYIEYKDRTVIIFYTNDLKATPSSRVFPSTSPEALHCCHGTFPLQRWTEDRMMHRKLFMAPAVIAAYNLCINAIDRVDQLRSTNPIRRREKRLGMAMFTWMMDLAIINSQIIQPAAAKGISLREFKRRMVDLLTKGEGINKRRHDLEQKKRKHEAHDEIDGMGTSFHMITPNSIEHSNGSCFVISAACEISRRSHGMGCSGATHSGNLHISATCTNGYIQGGHMQCGHHS
ncbi:unnamed protein product [Phytophthora fragariaefolia]|uniref:Unnamed protein product n=1 Tax=Phytophthora fragariaefolia TaxID=1490495 RepID=A0A9W7D2S3_9STRA|nr:unnamed protein product [Phytophthora fragariaefolia]